MPKPLGTTLASVYGSVALDLQKRLGDAQAAQMGPPVASDIKPAGDAERVKAWNARNPEATDEAMLTLAQQKLAEHTQAGLPIEKAIAATAEDLTHFRYDQRLKLYTYGQPDLKTQIAEAERIALLAKRESTPNPLPPPPTMPSSGLTNAAMAPATAPEPPPISPPMSAPPPGPMLPGMPPSPPPAEPPGTAMPPGPQPAPPRGY